MTSNITSSSVTSADGTDIAFTVTGTGPALVIVDGAMSYREWSPTGQAVALALSDQYTVYTFDRRGRGDSGPVDPAWVAADAIQAEVADVAALIEHAGGEAALFGFSSGAVLAMEAVLAGLPITGLVLFEPPFVVTDDRPPVGPDYRERIQRFVAQGRPGDAVAQFLTEPSNFPAEFVEPMRSDPSWSGMEQLAPTLASDSAIMGQTMSGDPAALQRYAPVTLPALVISSQGSDPWMVAGATAIAGVLPHASHTALPGDMHDVPPEVLAPAVSDWLPTLQN